MRYSKIVCSIIIVSMTFSGCAINPEPLDENKQLISVMRDQSELYGNQEPISHPLSFYDVLARALKYNFEHRLSIMETVLQDSQLDVATLNMLPKLTLNAGYLGRQSQLGSSSVDYYNQNLSSQLTKYSTSQDVARTVADLSFQWNILDFGVSYFQAKQQANRILIAKERSRKVVNNLVKEALAAYWTTHVADRLLPKITPVLEKAQKAYELSQKVQKDSLQPLIDVLEYQRSLLRIIDQLKKLRADMMLARPKLMGLINVPMNSKIELAKTDKTPVPSLLKATGIELEKLGLFYRPELREEVYQERISRDEAWKEMVKIMPGISIPVSINYDSNSFLVHSTWMEAGVRSMFNLINLLSAPKVWKSAKTQIEVVKLRRKALCVSTLVQINISHLQYLKAVDSYQSASELNKVDDSIFKLMSNNEAQGSSSELELIYAATSSIASQLEKEQSLAEIYAALGNIYASIGIDPINADIQNLTVSAIAAQLEKNMGQWYKGDLPKLPAFQLKPLPTIAKDDKDD